MGTLWYFAYGSNLSPAIFEDRRQMRPLARHRSRLDGFRLTFDIPVGPGERGVANLIDDPASRTHGVAYELSPSDADRLDRSEGVPHLYRRVAVTLLLDDDTRLYAFTYQSGVSSPGRKPSPRYLGLLLEGARHHGLPGEWIRHLDGWERAVDEREPG